ncbi:Na+/H+ antiporter NhaA [Pseudoxanthomonas sp. 10H]|uniref:Na+/H+ antiporter NhaA n=1 Tax=Pseudoxanthomonas sp. 10H TaxID=3242729 RepID=UPI00355742C9
MSRHQAPPVRRAHPGEDLSQLPPEISAHLARPFLYFIRVAAMAGAALLAATMLALALANGPWATAFLALWEMPAGIAIGTFDTTRSIRHWINDGLMALFFFVVSLELKRELVLGELRTVRAAMLPAAAALGGMAVPVIVFLLLVEPGPAMHGWGTVMSTDTAFVVGCLAVLGSRIPGSLRLFLLSLAIFDDVGAILVVAIGYGGPLDWGALAAAGAVVLTIVAVRRLGVRAMPVYVALGLALWVALDLSGVHATVSGVVLGLMTPSGRWVSGTRLRAILDRVASHPLDQRWGDDRLARQALSRAGTATREVLSPLERLEMALHPWVAFGVLPLFALANAGVPFGRATVDTGLVLATAAAFVIGKPTGIVLASVLAVRLRLAVRPASLPWKLLAAGSLLTGIGFTMALFVAELAFDADRLDSAKAGVLVASVVCALAGLGAIIAVTRGPRTPGPANRRDLDPAAR